MSEANQRAIVEVARWFEPGHRILFVTGAGLSADSGLPTYRGMGGLYGPDRRTRHGCTIEEALSGPMMECRPEITWEALHELAKAGRGARPNRGHEVMAELERDGATVWILTQNVDGLHRQAGSRHVIDIHGDLRRLLCTRPRCDYVEDVETYDALDPLPRCLRCGAVIRPDVVLFGEMLPVDKLTMLRRELDRGFDIVFTVGTSSLFPYIIDPVIRASHQGTPTVEINPERTDVSDLVDFKFAAGAAETLDRLYQAGRDRLG
jgi:NAD-dependent deacetylase